MKAKRKAFEGPGSVLIDPVMRPCPFGCGYVSENELDLGVHYRAAHPRLFQMKGPGKKGRGSPPSHDASGPGPLPEEEPEEEPNEEESLE